MNDIALKKNIQSVQKDIGRLARKYHFKAYKFWNYLDYHEQEPEEMESCACVLTCDEDMLASFGGYGNYDFESEFGELLEDLGFEYEIQRHGVIHIYSDDDHIKDQYKDLLKWQWVTQLIKPEYTNLYSELFAFFESNPDKFYSLKPRQLEFYIGEVFRNQGYDVEMGPGTNDGGIDLRLYQKQDIDQITTLVQVKRYKKSLPIRLDAVAALYGHVEAEKAQAGLFVSTSRYLPGALKFANRLTKKVTLADPNDLITWSSKVKTTIINDRAKLISEEQLLQSIKYINEGRNRELILVHHQNSGIIYCEFALVLKETKFAALVIMLPKKIADTYDPPYNSRGHEVPVLDSTILKNKTNDRLFRVTVSHHEDGTKTYRGMDMYFTVWDGKPGYFDHND